MAIKDSVCMLPALNAAGGVGNATAKRPAHHATPKVTLALTEAAPTQSLRPPHPTAAAHQPRRTTRLYRLKLNQMERIRRRGIWW